MPNVVRIAANHIGRHRAQVFVNHALLLHAHIGLAPAIQAVFGFDTAKQQVFATLGIKEKGLYACDLHAHVPPVRCLLICGPDPHWSGVCHGMKSK